MSTKRMIGHCTTKDFNEVIEIAVNHESGTPLPTLTKRQKLAMIIISQLQEAKIPLSATQNIRQVLFWELDGKTILEYQLFKPDPAMGVLGAYKNLSHFR